MKKQFKREVIDKYSFFGKLSKVTKSIDALVKKYGDDSELDFDIIDDYDGPVLEISILKLETDEEFNKRTEQEKSYERHKRQQRLRQYNRLKKEFKNE